MVAQCRENARFGQIETQLTHRFPQHVQIIRARLIPHVVRRQIARPDHEVDVLKKSGRGRHRQTSYSTWVFPAFNSILIINVYCYHDFNYKCDTM